MPEESKCTLCDWIDSCDIENFICEDIIDELENTHTDSITMNNLIFNFRDYKFNLEMTDVSCKITFNPKAIGGFKHASYTTGATFEVHHAVPSTLQHYQTTYVNTIDIEYSQVHVEKHSFSSGLGRKYVAKLHIS